MNPRRDWRPDGGRRAISFPGGTSFSPPYPNTRAGTGASSVRRGCRQSRPGALRGEQDLSRVFGVRGLSSCVGELFTRSAAARSSPDESVAGFKNRPHGCQVAVYTCTVVHVNKEKRTGTDGATSPERAERIVARPPARKRCGSTVTRLSFPPTVNEEELINTIQNQLLQPRPKFSVRVSLISHWLYSLLGLAFLTAGLFSLGCLVRSVLRANRGHDQQMA
jgi:hypothetical protein